MSFSFGAPAASSGASPFNFGAAPATPTPAAATGSPGFNFGSAPAATGAGSSFNFGGGGAGTAAAPAATGSSFGGFGGATGGAFGASNQTAKPPLFGQKTGTATGSGFGFGGATSTGSSLFGGFGATTQPATGATPGFGFGAPGGAAGGSSTFGTAPAAVSSPAPIIVGADAAVAQLNTVKYAYMDPAQSRFKFLLYNAVDPTQRHLYTRPAHISERQWNQAELDNPDPLHFAPAPVVGFADLLKRVQVQQEHAAKYDKFTDDLRAQLQEMAAATRATEEKLEKCRHEHVQLFHTLVKVMKDIELLQNYGKPLQRNEMQLAMMMKKLQTLLDSPAQYKARLKDAVALQRIQDAAPAPPGNQLSPEDLQRVYQFLDKQRQGLEHLTSILNDDLADIKLIKETWRR
ncbi:hypothetical protein PybrP1_009778 [[Pythium] brassicae (nom. inval.)]|nr:hypothetical protein PybrP1_009778 [[Pythium] brassicae (nom. inval.)]